jgi:type III pantothenate kinase
MLLLIDAGNTSIKWALAAPLAPASAGAALGRWLQSGECAQPEAAGLAAAWRVAAADDPVARVLVSNVAGAALRAQLAAQLQQAFGAALRVDWFASQPALAGVRNGYRDPAQLGCDRFAAAIGAHALFPQQPLIVAHCGTATTVDALTADGVFLGGMILPGLGLMMRALAAHTAQLPQTAPQPAALDRFADNTVDAIVSGCIAAQAGALERALALHAQTQAAAVQCVLAGGAAAWIAPHLSVPCARVDNLVLIGLQAVSAHDDMSY